MYDKLLSPEEVSAVLSVTPKTIREWLRKGELRGIKTGKLWRIREQDLQTFIKPEEPKAKELKFDFESLEERTSKEFVDHIRSVMELSEKDGFQYKDIKVKERSHGIIVEVFLISDIIQVFTYARGKIHTAAYNRYDLEEIISWLE